MPHVDTKYPKLNKQQRQAVKRYTLSPAGETFPFSFGTQIKIGRENTYCIKLSHLVAMVQFTDANICQKNN